MLMLEGGGRGGRVASWGRTRTPGEGPLWGGDSEKRVHRDPMLAACEPAMQAGSPALKK